MNNTCSAALLVCVVFYSLACAPSPEAPPTMATESTSAEESDQPLELTADGCFNAAAGYAVRYPLGWQVYDGDVIEPCSLFDPAPIEVPRESELPHQIAVAIDVEPVRYSEVTAEVHGLREIAREQTTVAARNAVRITGASTGEGLHDRGLMSYHYFVDLGDETLIAVTYGEGSLPFEQKRRVLDAMMQTLEIQERARER